MSAITGNASSQPEVASLGELNCFLGLSTTNKHRQIPQELVQGRSLDISIKTADYTMTAAESGTIFTNTGATGTVVISLPVAAVGLHVRAYVRAAQALRLDPNGTEVISNPTAGSPDGGAGKYIGSSTVGNAIHLVCLATGRWEVLSTKGTWTAEP